MNRPTPRGRRALLAAVLAVALALAGCRPRPDVRVLVDARLETPVSELLALYEMRTGAHVSATYASDQRVRMLLETGNHDVALVESAAFDAIPVTSPFPRESQRSLARDGAGHTFRLGVRGSPPAEAGRRLGLFLSGLEAAARLLASGLAPVPDVGSGAGPR